jgi:transcriptional regulator with XRE-family HTH domain
MNNNLGIFIKNERLKKRMSLRAFAQNCGISHTHLDSIEKGKDFRTGKPVSVTMETLMKLAACLNVKPQFLTELIYENDRDNIQYEILLQDEKELIENYRKADEQAKAKLLIISEHIN